MHKKDRKTLTPPCGCSGPLTFKTSAEEGEERGPPAGWLAGWLRTSWSGFRDNSREIEIQIAWPSRNNYIIDWGWPYVWLEFRAA